MIRLERLVPYAIRQIIRRQAIMECRDAITTLIGRGVPTLPADLALSIARAEITDLMTRPEPPPMPGHQG